MHASPSDFDYLAREGREFWALLQQEGLIADVATWQRAEFLTRRTVIACATPKPIADSRRPVDEAKAVEQLQRAIANLKRSIRRVRSYDPSEPIDVLTRTPAAALNVLYSEWTHLDDELTRLEDETKACLKGMNPASRLPASSLIVRDNVRDLAFLWHRRDGAPPLTAGGLPTNAFMDLVLRWENARGNSPGPSKGSVKGYIKHF